MLARALAKFPEFDVDFVVRHTAPLRKLQYDGVRLRPVIDRLYRMRESVSTRVEKRRQFPFLRFRSFTPSLLWQIPILAACRPFRGSTEPWKPQRILVDPPADIYCTFGVQSNSATVISSAHQINRPVVLLLGSDSDLDERYTEGSTFVSPYRDVGDTCWRILREADVVVCQTAWQQAKLASQFGREGHIIPNPIDIEQWDADRQRIEFAELPSDVNPLDRYLLWVGRAERVHKQPQLFLKLARELPEIPCVMVLNPREGDLEDEIRRRAPPNLRIIRHVPFPAMPALFSRAAALISTSSLEGFANVFLQAAVSRVPVVSLNVGTEFLAQSGVGETCDGDWERFRGKTQQAWDHPRSSEDLERARNTVLAQHSLAAVSQQFKALLLETVRR